MSSSDKLPLEDLAEGLADGVAIDWEQARAEHGDNLEGLRGLQLLEAVGKTFHIAGTTHVPDETEPVLFQWGPLDVIEKLDEGSFGEVYRAIDRQLQRPVALKLRKVTTGGDDDDWVAEGRRLARLRHPNVLTVHGVASHDGRVGLWTELLTSHNLRQQLTENGSLTLDELVAVGQAVSDALTAIHETGMVHGDVKASNVVREKDGQIVLLDFGSSTEVSQVSSGSQGSPLTTAPEVLEGAKPSPRSDIYSLGAMLYLLASGRPPIDTDRYEELQRQAREGRVPPLATLRPDLPPSFTAAVHRALEVNPDQRYPSAKALAAALHLSVSAPANEEEQPTPLGLGLGRPITTLSMICLAIALLAATWWVFSSTTVDSPLGVRADLIRAGEPTISLADGASIRPGDRLAMQLELEQPTYIYLINADQQGESFVLFPLPTVELQNPLPVGSHRLPGNIAGEPQNWVVTSTGGSEEFLVVASSHPLPLVEEFIEGTRMAGGGAAARTGESSTSEPGAREYSGSDDSWETVRGVGGLAPSEAPTIPNLEALRQALGETDDRVWLRWLRLDNP